ncbi:MAG: sensor histidine kinase [Caulobacteraceae bacterium]
MDIETIKMPAQPPPEPSLPSYNACDDCSIVREADHRIANHLALLASYVRLKALDHTNMSATPSRESVQVLLESIRFQIEAISRVHRSLTLGAGVADNDLSQHVHEVCAPLRSILNGRIELIESLASDCEVTAKQILPLTQVVVEALTNAIKHAYPHNGVGKILVCTRRGEMLNSIVEISDGGCGLLPSFNSATDGGFGFRLMRALTKGMGATIEFQSCSPGLRISLALPPA